MFCKMFGNVSQTGREPFLQDASLQRSVLEAMISALLRSIGGSIDSAAKGRMVNKRVADGSRCKSGTVAPL